MEGNGFIIEHYSEHFGSKDRKIEIPQSVVHICKESFKEHTRMTKLTIHEKVRKIGKSAFEYCSNLEKVKMFGESELVVIPERCFKDCTALKSFTIPPEVGVIKKYAFSGCTGISHIVIPETVIAIEAGAFDKWTENQTIEIYSNFKFGIVCKATIINHTLDNTEVDEEEVYETSEGKYMYAVTTKCGHVKRRRYMKITFPIIAETKKEASEIGRYSPRVKHDHKDAVLDVRQINKKEYDKLEEINSNDPYLKMKNSSMQKDIQDLVDKRSLPETNV